MITCLNKMLVTIMIKVNISCITITSIKRREKVTTIKLLAII